MKTLQFVNPARCFLDIGQDSLQAFNGTAGVELPLERLPDGKLTDKCKQSLVTELQKFIARKPWQPRARVFCAIPARGVSLGRTGSELITIESGLPVAVRAVAWGVDDLARGELPLVCENAPSLGPPAAGRGREASFGGTGPPLQPPSVSCDLAPLLKLING